MIYSTSQSKQRVTHVKFESRETVMGRVRGSDEWITYQAMLRVEDAGKNPVSLKLTFVPPHPFVVNMPEQIKLEAESVAAVFSKLVRFLDDLGVSFES